MDFFSQLGSDLSRAFSPELPAGLGNMDSHLDFIIPKVQPYGEDLREEHFWLSKRWKEIRDDETFHEAVLHIFNPGGEYLLAVDGNVLKGSWRQVGEINSLLLEIGGRTELFDLRFMNPEFMILTKHGDQGRKNQRCYFCLVRENVARGALGEADWRNIMEKLYNIWRENSLSIWAWLGFVILLGLFLYWSFN
ncbi:MAG: hypothetical protein ABIO24_00845 [Saprospiraceae bacterium]